MSMIVKNWGCHSQPRNDGYWGKTMYFSPVKNYPPQSDYIWIKDTATKECQYRKETPDDPRCIECTCL